MNISSGVSTEQEPESWIPLLPHLVPGFSSCHRAALYAFLGASFLSLLFPSSTRCLLSTGFCGAQARCSMGGLPRCETPARCSSLSKLPLPHNSLEMQVSLTWNKSGHHRSIKHPTLGRDIRPFLDYPACPTLSLGFKLGQAGGSENKEVLPPKLMWEVSPGGLSLDPRQGT